jgi:hypothetical protein
MSRVLRIPPVTDKAASDRAWAIREASCKLAELGYEVCEFTLGWPTALAWNLAQAGLAAAGAAAVRIDRDRARAERDAYRDALEDAGASNECCEDRLGDLKSDVQRRLTVIELASRTP